MKTNTIKARRKVYKKLLRAVCNDSSVEKGMCYYLTEMGVQLYSLKELWWLKPERMHQYVYWFPRTYEGWKKRIALIQQAIEICDNKLKRKKLGSIFNKN